MTVSIYTNALLKYNSLTTNEIVCIVTYYILKSILKLTSKCPSKTMSTKYKLNHHNYVYG